MWIKGWNNELVNTDGIVKIRLMGTKDAAKCYVEAQSENLRVYLYVGSFQDCEEALKKLDELLTAESRMKTIFEEPHIR